MVDSRVEIAIADLEALANDIAECKCDSQTEGVYSRLQRVIRILNKKQKDQEAR